MREKKIVSIQFSSTSASSNEAYPFTLNQVKEMTNKLVQITSIIAVLL